MARPGELLRRFRLLAVPGPAGLAGVPIDQSAQRRDELSAVFVDLAGTVQDAEEKAEQAKREVVTLREETERECARIANQAVADAPAARAAAAAATNAAAQRNAERVLIEAAAAVQSLEAEGAPRASSLADAVVEAILALGCDAEVPL